MAGTEPKLDPELLGRVAELPRSQQRWLRTVLQSIFAMEPTSKERRRGAPSREPEPRRQGLDELLSGEDTSEDYPELSEEIEGIAGIADLLRGLGRERRSLGEELRPPFEPPDEPGEDGEDEAGRPDLN